MAHSPPSEDRFWIHLVGRRFHLSEPVLVLAVLVSSLVLSRALVVLVTSFDSGVAVLSSWICEINGQFNDRYCRSYIGTATIDSLTAGLHWIRDMFTMDPQDDGPRGLIQALCRWDCGWYAYIWTHGYDVEPFSNHTGIWVCFPLFPLLVAIFAHWWPASVIGHAIALNHVLLLASAWLLYLLARHLLENRAVALTAAALFVLSPMSLYSSAPMTEALFNALSIGAIYAAYKSRWLASGLAMALLTATRPNGLLIMFPVLMIAVREVGLRDVFRIHEHARIWFALSLAPMGLCLYALHLHLVMGDALAFSNAQVPWRKTLEAWPWGFYRHFTINWEKGWHGRALYLSFAGLLGVCAVGYLWWRKLKPEAVFLGLIAAMTIGWGLSSLPRYLLAIWPAYIALALVLRDKPKTTTTVAAAFLALLPIYTVAWINGSVWLP